MTYTVTIEPHAIRQLKKISGDQFQRIQGDLRALADNPRPFGCTKLVARRGYRIYVGSGYRAIYEIDEQAKVVTVTDVAPRKDIYRKR